LDGVHDVTEYEKDFQGRLPNLLYMKLSQKMRPRNIPSSKKEAVAKAIHLGCYSELEDFVEARAGEVSSFNFGNCVHLKQAIEEKRREFHSEAVSP
jgi:hypothetical protein